MIRKVIAGLKISFFLILQHVSVSRFIYMTIVLCYVLHTLFQCYAKVRFFISDAVTFQL